jgi:hypothetical protein
MCCAQVTERTLRWLEYPEFYNPQMPRYTIQIFEQGIFNDAACSAIIGRPVDFRMHHWKEQSISVRTGFRYCESQMHVRFSQCGWSAQRAVTTFGQLARVNMPMCWTFGSILLEVRSCIVVQAAAGIHKIVRATQPVLVGVTSAQARVLQPTTR